MLVGALNLGSQALLLGVQGSDVLVLGAADLVGDLVVEVEVVNSSLHGGNPDLLFLDVRVGSDLLHLEGLLLLQGHADLAKLEEELEVGEEGNHMGSVLGVGDSHKDFTLLPRVLTVNGDGALVDLLGHALDEVSLHLGWVALLDSRREGLLGGEEVVAVVLVSSVLVASDELSQTIEDGDASATGRVVGGSTLDNDLLDGGEGSLVAVLSLLGLHLVHAGKENLEIADLVLVGKGLVLLGLNLSLDGSELGAELFLLGPDLKNCKIKLAAAFK